jgi:glycine cleavage system H protein
VGFLYTPSHAWLARGERDRWRVGLTKFATRMLGEMVDHGFDTAPGAAVKCGQVLGWVEGFKAISDLFCVADGRFLGSNPALKERIALISKSPYDSGWLYEVEGQPDARCIDVQTYRDHLDKTIERLLAQRKGEEIK